MPSTLFGLLAVNVGCQYSKRWTLSRASSKIASALVNEISLSLFRILPAIDFCLVVSTIRLRILLSSEVRSQGLPEKRLIIITAIVSIARNDFRKPAAASCLDHANRLRSYP